MSNKFEVGDIVTFLSDEAYRSDNDSKTEYKVVKVVDPRFKSRRKYDDKDEQVQHLFFDKSNAPNTPYVEITGPWASFFFKFVRKSTPVVVHEFKEDDQVEWRDDHYATLTSGRKKYGDGPFYIDKVTNYNDSDPDGRGHSQHVTIADCFGKQFGTTFSGRFFKKTMAQHNFDVRYDEKENEVKTVVNTVNAPAPAHSVVSGQQSKIDKQANVIRGMQGKISRQRKDLNDLQDLRYVEALDTADLANAYDELAEKYETLSLMFAEVMISIANGDYSDL